MSAGISVSFFWLIALGLGGLAVLGAIIFIVVLLANGSGRPSK